jgi:zinc transporter ZupT
MEQPDIEGVTRSLEALLQKERREALVYTLLTVLCTPVFVGVASLVIACAAVYFLRRSIGPIDRAMAMYTGVIIFLAWAIASVPVNAQRSPTGFGADRAWLAGGAVFLVLLVVTYATSLQSIIPFSSVWFMSR